MQAVLCDPGDMGSRLVTPLVVDRVLALLQPPELQPGCSNPRIQQYMNTLAALHVHSGSSVESDHGRPAMMLHLQPHVNADPADTSATSSWPVSDQAHLMFSRCPSMDPQYREAAEVQQRLHGWACAATAAQLGHAVSAHAARRGLATGGGEDLQEEEDNQEGAVYAEVRDTGTHCMNAATACGTALTRVMCWWKYRQHFRHLHTS